MVLALSVLVAIGGAVAGSLPVTVVGLVPPATYLLGVLAASAHAATRRPRLDLRSALALPATVRELAARREAGTLTELAEVKPWLRLRYLRMYSQMYLPRFVYDAIRLVTRPVRLLFLDKKA